MIPDFGARVLHGVWLVPVCTASSLALGRRPLIAPARSRGPLPEPAGGMPRHRPAAHREERD